MKTVQYGEWKIAVDVERTREYYKKYVPNDNQANRNFREYCKVMPAEEKAFFESFGIVPECCEIKHIGVNKNKEFPCGGYYLICGRYLKCPEEGTITAEEFAQNNFKSEREDPRITVGLFEFAFQCEDYIIKNIPEDIPEGFICVRFRCQNMRWLLDDEPCDDMIMYEPPRFLELGKIIKEKIAVKKQRASDLEERKQELKALFESLGIGHTLLGSKEFKEYKEAWVDAFSPENADVGEIRRICLSQKNYKLYLWHIFSYEYQSSEEDAARLYNLKSKAACVLIDNIYDIGFTLMNADRLTAEIIDGFSDITVTAADFSWTYCKTHEDELGPYYYESKDTSVLR
ncbi:MAG: DUF4275 family protein [Clostridia bacterium]|nr:DUF4275 family protein [Clostridia bacterium]